MENNDKNYDVAVKLWGDMACFTQPEFKVDRVTYPVMTPSAARGALEAIFWKPEIRWEIREIWVLSPIKEIAVLRNEINGRQSERVKGFIIEDKGKRQQRTSLFLKEPSYLIFADITLKENTQDCKMKYLAQFNRRLERGECFYQPYLGTRECSAYFSKANGDEVPIPESIVVGNMLFDIAFCKSNTRKELEFIENYNGQIKTVWGFTKPLFFTAIVEKGIMKVPLSKYEELYGLEGVHVKRIN